jgi:DNA helicase IV
VRNRSTELEHEQAYVSMVYDRLDGLRARTRRELERALRPDGGGHLQARLDRDAFVARHADRLAQLTAAEDGLCFGRLDLGDGSRLYVGRIGLLDDEREPLLVDWRAPAAQPFYRATPAAPGAVVRRRHLRTRDRIVLEIDDDVLNLEAISDAERDHLNGEAALLASLARSRTGRMTDIVATIQAEQDRVIRSDLPGILVVQGGPGTGKTAVALHRAAYLLYTHRNRLSRRGVLIAGPNPTFMRYIEQVLPSLGETDVLLSTVDALYPGVSATGGEPAAAATVKGDLRMAGVLAAAVQDRQQVPDAAVELPAGGYVLVLDRRTCELARRRARETGQPHNRARQVFQDALLDALARQVADHISEGLVDPSLEEAWLESIGVDDVLGPPPDGAAAAEPGTGLVDGEPTDEELAGIRAELRAVPAVRAALDRLWPELTPQQLLAGLFASAERLAAAAPDLSPAERAALLRPAPNPSGRPTGAPLRGSPDPSRSTGAPLRGSPDPSGGGDGAGGWTAADVPLLDEAAVLLGEDGEAARRAAARGAEQEAQELAYAREVLEGASIGDAARYAPDTSQLDPAVVADRWRRRTAESVAERARHDRTWTFGHVVVDEAQELSAMAWRMLMRRCPTRSMTVVGDLAQTGAPWGAGSWARSLDPQAPGRWRVEQLTVNYRTPAEIMAVAADVLAGVDRGLEPPRSVREAGTAPWSLQLDPAQLAARLPEVVAAEVAAVGDGRLAVLVPTARAEEVSLALRQADTGRLLAADPPAGTTTHASSVLEAPVVVLTVADAKGLEFDAVIVVEPAEILGGSPRGGNDLYVALTRATKRLGVVHSGRLPAVLARLRPATTAQMGSSSGR